MHVGPDASSSDGMNGAAGGWPENVFQAPLLRGINERGRRELASCGELRRIEAGATAYRRGDESDYVFVVAEGEIALVGTRRGDDDEAELRRAGAGDSFGEEASVGATFRATARALVPSVVAAIPVAMFHRALARAGGSEVAERFMRRVRRRATAELLRTLAFTSRLDERDRELLLDGTEHKLVLRGDVIYRTGEPAEHLWLVVDGMVQLQTEDDERLRVRAYLTAGDFFGDEEVVARVPRRMEAVASGASLLIAIAADVARTVADRNPDLLRRLRRVAEQQAVAQQAVVAGAKGQTQHAFHDLYRLQVARSLLVIDLDSCVRCGHCAWACESLHGVARLVRRGDKIVTRVGAAAEAPSPLLLPNSCQHCESPACMPDCPTGAIGRDPRGEVFIRDALCTGCGACAKGCPWDNIQIVPRPPDAPRPAGRGVFDELAVKCDLCRDHEGPACVMACPTESIFRLHPAADLPEVGRLLRAEGGADHELRAPSRWPWLALAGLGSAAFGIVGSGFQLRGSWEPWRGIGWGLGPACAAAVLGLLAYAIPKRRVRRGRGPASPPGDEARPRVRSRVRPQLTLHVVLGFAALALALGHGGPRFGPSSGGALLTALFASGVTGALAALCYALVPRRLSRIERTALLPEDYAAERRELRDRLYGSITGKSELVKKIFEKVLVPYLRAPWGALALVVSGCTLAAEERAVRARIDTMLEGRGAERLAGLEALIRTVVELRALAAARALTLTLRAWLPVHVISVAVVLATLAIHLFEVLR